MPTIKQHLTTVNRNTATNRAIKYLVLHYTYGTQTAEGAAYANCQYFKSVNRGASAHYFIDDGDTIWQSVEDKNIAWHCGATSYRHPSARNSNSIGIEVCTKGAYTEKEIQNAAWLVQKLMKQYGIPAANVIRHYDVTGKQCPAHYVDAARWAALKSRLVTGGSTVQVNPGSPVNDRNIAYQAHAQNRGWLARVRDGIFAGTKGGGLRLEALRIDLSNIIGDIELEVTVNIQNVGQKTYKVTKDNPDQIIGSVGKGQRLEMITIRVLKNTTGGVLKMQGHFAEIGDGGIVTLGSAARSIGSVDLARRMEAFRLWLAV